MCTGIVETTEVKGSGKGPNGWFKLEEVNVSYDHPNDAPLEHPLNIDFVILKMAVGARIAVELSPESARKLAATILTTLARGGDHVETSEASAELGDGPDAGARS